MANEIMLPLISNKDLQTGEALFQIKRFKQGPFISNKCPQTVALYPQKGLQKG